MAKHLIVAGHGRRKNGTFDPGATGYITKGEHRYVKEDLFPAMKKYADSDFIFFDSYNVFSHGNIVALARKYKVDTVTEVHFDAGSQAASGGHVIVYSHYKPDAMDLRLRDAIASMVGVRYSHAGHRGISGRSNLANVNRTASGGVNYRMLELGFGTNKRDADVLMNQTDEYAKKLVEAIKGSKSIKPSTPIKPSKPSKPEPKPNKPSPAKPQATGGSIVNYMNSKGMDSSYNNRAKLAGQYGIKNYRGTASQNIELLNKLQGGSVKPSVNHESIANQVLKGIDNRGRRIPTGRSARAKHFNISMSDIDKVQAIVNRKLK